MLELLLQFISFIYFNRATDNNDNVTDNNNNCDSDNWEFKRERKEVNALKLWRS